MSDAPSQSARTLAPGVIIRGKLEILRHLSDGGMGAIWVAKNLDTEANVAVKALHRRSRMDVELDAIERFRHEARIGAMLEHRHITKVFDLIEDTDGTLLLVMELLRGVTLEQCIRDGAPLTCAEAIRIIVPILGALHHAHERGVVHRDLKPSNIFLHVDPDGHVSPKLLDFGVAKTKTSSVTTSAGNVLGTPAYMSPEQVRVSPTLDGRSDVFAAATVLYEVITGENPFVTDAPSATLARVLELEVDPDPRIEPRVWREMRRALSKQPYERHGSAAELARALRVARREAEVKTPAGPAPSMPLAVTPPAPPAPAREPSQVAEPSSERRPRGRLAAVAIAIAILAVAALAAIATRVPVARPRVAPRPASSASSGF